MPNTLGTPYVQGIQSGATFPLVDPRQVRTDRRRFRRDRSDPLELANSLYVPAGGGIARGWVLVKRSAVNAMATTRVSATGLYATNFQLNFDECVTGGNQQTFKNLAIVQARCVSTGIVDDPNADYLVELTDGRGVLFNRFFRFPLNRQYNVVSPAYPTTYYADSMNSGSAWTWSTMVQDIWQAMPLLGTYPGLPISPAGTPEGWIFAGVNGLDALMRVLTHLGCTIGVNLTLASPYTIVNSGGGDASFDNLVTLYTQQHRLLDDAAWMDVGSGRVPGTVVVMFHRRNEVYGTEETVRRDTLQWETTPAYSVSVSAPAFFTGAAGTHYLWDDFTVRYDVNGSPVAADVTTAATIAAERSQQYFNAVYSGTLGSMRKQWTGVLPFYCGANCDGVCWRQDFRDERRLSWITEIVRSEPPIWPELNYGMS